MGNSDARKQKIMGAVIAANPDIEPVRLAKIVDLALRMATPQRRKR